MINKKYQVFVSSTYTDLQEERKNIHDSLILLDCIPSGMEFFTASDDEQFEFIKKVIDDCDYYILIIGGRYGSLSDDGISFTEKEYEYAKSKKIPILSFIHKNLSEIPFGKVDNNEEKMKLLEKFKEKVSENKLVRFWNDGKELPGLVTLSLTKAIKMYPGIGWIRGINIDENEEIRQENLKLLRENSLLKEKISEFEKIKLQKYFFSTGYHFNEIHEILTKEKILVPQGMLGAKKTEEYSLINIFMTLKEMFLMGIWNSKARDKEEIFIFYNVCPKLAFYNLLEKDNISGGTAQKFQLSEDGKKMVTLIEMNLKKSNV